MSKNLVIVESPAKAKTIEGYLGKDFTVKSSFGHVRDLPKDDMAIDLKNGYQPTYEISADKREVISQLKKLAKEAETIWLATDDDREGEAISWHLKEALGLNDDNTRRIVFHEITKQAIQKAIQSPRGIDIDLVNAQQARRVLDRLVGFELSPVLWKKVKAGLSAGRVQSVAVRIVVEREREIDKFQPQSSFKISARFDLPEGKVLNAELPKRFAQEGDAMHYLQQCLGATFSIRTLEKKPGKKSPAPPFTTSTLQQEASRKLGFSVSQTMTLAQKLYESGKITYMRTDSVNLSEEAINAAAREIQSAYGPEYVQTRRYKTKSASAQEAHEAIRPTDFSVSSTGDDRGLERLYELIWKRAIASQMADAQLERTVVNIAIAPQQGEAPADLVAQGEVIKFDGFLKVYIESSDDDEDEEQSGMLPPLTIGQTLDLHGMRATERFSRPPARYTEASLVKKLEEMGIGRPSTYAPTISTVQRRNYVVKESRDGKERTYRELELQKEAIKTKQLTETYGTEKNKLFPTDLAMVVNDFLVQYFPSVIDFSFTATIEKEFDEIANGRLIWNNMIDSFYKEFHPKVESTDDIERATVGTVRELGLDPKTGKLVIVRLGRYGPLAQIGSSDDEEEEKPQFASLRKDQRLETITLEEALELFKLPREVGTFEGKTVTAAIGRFGPYIRHDNKFISIPKGEDPLEISGERAIELIEQKRIADAEKFIKTFEENPDVQVLKGRFGPYIKVGKQNVKIPKDKEPASLTLEECLALAEAAPKKGGRGAAKASADTKEKPKKAATKKASTKAKAKPKAKGTATAKSKTKK
ncbi:DNA topoisomerase-1 [Catalinimonas alkaloidigena]|uniref:DNA topoisomerase 1 n=1 Tax=Catalinimonas alkaloidigena TaxID=1075417 RepID=A0A1G8XVV5_9BACT|nr:type I DNA topoisomerase [Catalinimonas alkaloidigena]SDJ94627.1 DNA topoisomerase-1 [Catalinimonas alkaloidigena]